MFYSVPGFQPLLNFIVPIDRYTPRSMDVLSVAGPKAALTIKVLVPVRAHGCLGQLTTSPFNLTCFRRVKTLEEMPGLCLSTGIMSWGFKTQSRTEGDREALGEQNWPPWVSEARGRV